MAAHGWGLDTLSGLELAKLRTSLMLSQLGGSMSQMKTGLPPYIPSPPDAIQVKLL